MREKPRNLRSLEARINNIARDQQRPLRRAQRAIANTVVGQMLPPSVVKGGTAMKARMGEAASRFTPDFDAARAAQLGLEEYLEQLEDKLAEGWGGFTATITAVDPPQPEGVPEDYIMQPYDIRLAYEGTPWLTVRFELGRDEVDSTEHVEMRLAQDIIDLFDELGLPTPEPLPVLVVEHQVAQKLHACTSVSPKTNRNERAHDLVDLQLLEEEEEVDMVAVNTVTTRLFASRRTQTWPPEVRAYDGWDTLYAEAADGLDVLPDVDEAVRWANGFIERAVEAGQAAGGGDGSGGDDRGAVGGANGEAAAAGDDGGESAAAESI